MYKNLIKIKSSLEYLAQIGSNEVLKKIFKNIWKYEYLIMILNIYSQK